MTIVRVGNEFELVSRKGKNLGKYHSNTDALRREKQVEYFKHIKETNKMTRISFKDFIAESAVPDHVMVGVHDGSDYGDDVDEKDADHILAGALKHNGSYHGHSNKGPTFKFKNVNDAKNFKDHVSKAPNKTMFADLMTESEQIDELSSDTLASYKRRAGAEAYRLDKQANSGTPDRKTSDALRDKAHKRFKGIMKATMKEGTEQIGEQNKKVFLTKESLEDYSHENLQVFSESEEFEQLDELSKKTLRDYLVKVPANTAKHARNSGVSIAAGNHAVSNKSENKVSNRIAGTVRAAYKIAKESVELDEAGFDWIAAAKGKLKSDDHKSNTGVHKARRYGAQDNDDEDRKNEPQNKKSVGRPSGNYGSYKIDKTSRQDPDYKKQLSQKVMAAKAENFQIRKEFKDLMNSALKKKQAETYQEQNK